MTLSVSFQEIYDILVAKIGKKILLKTVNDKTVTVGYEQKMRVPMIGTVHKIVWLNITVEKLQNEELHLSYDAGRGVTCLSRYCWPSFQHRSTLTIWTSVRIGTSSYVYKR